MDMCTLIIKQTASHYLFKGTPVFSVFLHASKAFDRVNYTMFFRKLKQHNVPSCFVRLLQFKCRNQTMKVRWGNCPSQPFQLSNSVRHQSILGPHLFAIYMDDLSHKLNKVHGGCFIDNVKFKHSFMLMIFAAFALVL